MRSALTFLGALLGVMAQTPVIAPDPFDDFRGAEQHHKAALTACLTGPDGSLCRMSACNALIAIYLQFHEVGEAVKLTRRVSAADRLQLGALHPQSIAFEGNLAALDFARGEVKAALQRYEQVWLAWNRAPSPDAALRLNLLNNWGVALLADDRAVAALGVFRIARDIAKESGGPSYCVTLSNLATAYAAAGDSDAGGLFREAIDLAGRLKGRRHPFVAAIMQSYAAYLNVNGRGTKGARLASHAASIIREYAARQQLGLTIDAGSGHAQNRH